MAKRRPMDIIIYDFFFRKLTRMTREGRFSAGTRHKKSLSGTGVYKVFSSRCTPGYGISVYMYVMFRMGRSVYRDKGIVC